MFVLIALVAVGIYLYGMSQPAQQQLTVEKNIAAPADQVWQVMTDWGAQPQWRDDLEQVEVIDAQNFVEYPKQGSPIRFEVLKAEKPRLLELKLDGSFNGVYTVRFKDVEGGTLVEESYDLNYPSPIGRIFVKLFFNLEAFAHDYLGKLGQRVLSVQAAK